MKTIRYNLTKACRIFATFTESLYVTSHEILGPNEVPGRNCDIDIF